LVRVRDAEEAALRLRGSAEFIRVRRGVYTPAEEWHQLHPWERYLARVHAFALVRPEAVFALESAAALCGLPLFGEPRDVHIFDQRRSRSLRYGDISVHTSRDRRDAVHVGGLAMCGVLDTVIDLVRVLPPAYGLAVTDAALRRWDGRVEAGDLRDLSAARSSRRGLWNVSWVLDRATPASESVGESVSRAVIEWWGFAPPELQHDFFDGRVRRRSDFFWPDHRVIGESDGYGKYDGDDISRVKAHFVAEKRREDRLRRQVDGFARWDWSDVMRTVPLRDALLAAGLPQIAPVHTALLRTVGVNRRSL
jgi:hypothetical protein